MISYKLYLAWLGVDFVLPLSQQQEQQEEEGPPHQNLSEGGVLEG